MEGCPYIGTHLHKHILRKNILEDTLNFGTGWMETLLVGLLGHSSNAGEMKLFGPECVVVHWQKLLGEQGKSEQEEEWLGAEEGAQEALWGKDIPAYLGHFLSGGGAAFELGNLPVCRAGSLLCLAFCHCAPLAALQGNPVRRVKAPVSTCEGGNGALTAPSPPCK